MEAPAKLTLRLDATLIERAKDFAQVQGRSVSQLVADYFAHLVPPGGVEAARSRQSPRQRGGAPITAALRGSLRPVRSAPLDKGRDAYRAYLDKKYR
jgi:hypothetical protein